MSFLLLWRINALVLRLIFRPDVPAARLCDMDDDAARHLYRSIVGVMFLFSGVFFPLDGLPAWIGWAAWLLPLTHAVILMRALTSGTLESSMWVSVAWLAVFTLVAFWLSVRLIRRRLIR